MGAHALLSKAQTQDDSGVQRALEEADVYLQVFLEAYYNDRGHLLLTQWPLWLLLLELTDMFIALQDRKEQNAGAASDVGSQTMLIAHCGNVELSLPEGMDILVTRTSNLDCRSALLQSIRTRSAEAEWTVLLSPFLSEWTAGQMHALTRAVKFMNSYRTNITGFPTADSKRHWRWPVRRMRHEFWRLKYEPYPTGYSLALGSCVGGHTTSATRVYRTSVLRSFLEEITSDSGDKDGALLLVELDILALRAKMPAYTCMELPFIEESSYLERVKLTKRCGIQHSIEIAEFTLASHLPQAVGPSAGRQDVCSNNLTWRWNSPGQNVLDADAYDLVQQGMASGYCYRKYLQRLVSTVVNWWLDIDPEHHVALPKQGTLLTSLVRGGEFGAMPWELDLEFILASTGANPVYDACRAFLRSGGSWQAAGDCAVRYFQRGLRSSRVVIKDYVKPVTEMLYNKYGILGKMRLEVDQSLDIQLHGFLDPSELYKVKLFGTDFHFSWTQWEYQLFEIYGGNLRKKVGTSGTIDKSEACPEGSKHSACFHDTCTKEAAQSYGCTLELSDWFAHAWPM